MKCYVMSVCHAFLREGVRLVIMLVYLELVIDVKLAVLWNGNVFSKPRDGEVHRLLCRQCPVDLNWAHELAPWTSPMNWPHGLAP